MRDKLFSQKLDGGWDSKDIHQGCMSELNLIQGVQSPGVPHHPLTLGYWFGTLESYLVFMLISPIPPLSEIFRFSLFSSSTSLGRLGFHHWA